jgi:hypothetical protein
MEKPEPATIKKIYTPPKLETYGTLRAITENSNAGFHAADNGVPQPGGRDKT